MSEGAGDTTEEDSLCLLEREVPKDYLLDLKQDRVKVAYENTYEEWRQDKKNTMNVINDALKTSFIQAAQDRHFTYKKEGRDVGCDTTYDINKAWKHNPQRQEDFAFICRGHFSKDWEMQMEEVVMKKLGLKYMQNPLMPNKGCFARLCVKRRTEMVKSWNQSSKKVHGLQCHVTRPSKLINKENRFEKRKKGVFYFGETKSNSVNPKNEEADQLRGKIDALTEQLVSNFI